MTESAALQRLGRMLTLVIDTAQRRPGEHQELATVRQHTVLLSQCLEQLRTRRRARILALRRLRRPADGADPLQPPLPGLGGAMLPGNSEAEPAHLSSLEAFAAHYIATRLDGQDPELGEGEWQELFSEALAEAGPQVLRRDEMDMLRGPDQLREGERLSALAHAELGNGAHESALAHVPADQALAALEACRFTVDRLPRPSDRVDTWFTATTIKRLQAANLPTLQAVADRIAQRGARWWVQVPGLGARRAQRLRHWLHEVAGISPSAPSSPRQPAFAFRWDNLVEDALAPQLQALQLEPLGALLAPDTATSWAARQDVLALCRALAPYRHRPATLAVYSREMLRFALWCHLVHGTTVVAASSADVQAFAMFLQDIPAGWIRTSFAARGTADWRPFRGQLTAASLRKSVAVVRVVAGTMSGAQLVDRVAPALPAVAGPPQPFDATRAFNVQQWTWLQSRLVLPEHGAASSRPDAPTRRARVSRAAQSRRLAAALQLLATTGLRREECVRARWADLQTRVVNGVTHWQLQAGSGPAQRTLAVPSSVVHALRAHAEDRAGLFADDWHTPAGRARIPLLSVLEHPQRWAAERGPRPSPPQPCTAARCGALSPDGLYKILRQFLVHCIDDAAQAGLDAGAFERASLHWLRHTFGRSQAAQGRALSDLQRAMGHARRSTTAHYARTGQPQDA